MMAEEFEQLSKDELKQLVKDRGLDEEIDLRRGREDIIKAIKALSGSSAPESVEAPATPTPPPGVAGDPPRYRVTEDSRFVIHGLLYVLRKDTVVTYRTHDLDALRAQNVPMVSMAPGETVPQPETLLQRMVR